MIYNLFFVTNIYYNCDNIFRYNQTAHAFAYNAYGLAKAGILTINSNAENEC